MSKQHVALIHKVSLSSGYPDVWKLSLCSFFFTLLKNLFSVCFPLKPRLLLPIILQKCLCQCRSITMFCHSSGYSLDTAWLRPPTPSPPPPPTQITAFLSPNLLVRVWKWRKRMPSETLCTYSARKIPAQRRDTALCVLEEVQYSSKLPPAMKDCC